MQPPSSTGHSSRRGCKQIRNSHGSLMLLVRSAWICSSGPSYTSIPQAADPIIWPQPPEPSPRRPDVDAFRSNQGGALLPQRFDRIDDSPWESSGSLAAEHLDPKPDCQVVPLRGCEVWAKFRTITIFKDREIERYRASQEFHVLAVAGRLPFQF